MLRLPAKKIEDVPDKKLEEILNDTPIEEEDIKRYGLVFRPGFIRNDYQVYKDKLGRLYFFEKKKQAMVPAIENFQKEDYETEAARPVEEMKDVYYLRYMICLKDQHA